MADGALPDPILHLEPLPAPLHGLRHCPSGTALERETPGDRQGPAALLQAGDCSTPVGGHLADCDAVKDRGLSGGLVHLHP